MAITFGDYVNNNPFVFDLHFHRRFLSFFDVILETKTLEGNIQTGTSHKQVLDNIILHVILNMVLREFPWRNELDLKIAR